MDGNSCLFPIRISAAWKALVFCDDTVKWLCGSVLASQQALLTVEALCELDILAPYLLAVYFILFLFSPW